METQVYSPIILRPNLVDALTRVREEWEQAAEGRGLIMVKGSVGLLFYDLAMAIGLTSEETDQVFGANLSSELREFLAPQRGALDGV